MSATGVLDNDILEDLIDDIKDNLQEIPTAIAALFATKQRTKIATENDDDDNNNLEDEEAAKGDSSTTPEETPVDDDEKVHSIKPGTKIAPTLDDRDRTWLDKLITKVENAIKAFFNIKI